jgi:hypothetical protein
MKLTCYCLVNDGRRISNMNYIKLEHNFEVYFQNFLKVIFYRYDNSYIYSRIKHWPFGNLTGLFECVKMACFSKSQWLTWK